MIVTARGTGHVDRAAIARFLNEPNGPVRRDLDRRAVRVSAAMTRGCPRRTGLLASTVRKNRGRSAVNPHVDVIVGRDGVTDYLGYILAGTPPHLITPNTRKWLRFTVHGTVVFVKVVRHPGTAPNNFVLKALPAAVT